MNELLVCRYHLGVDLVSHSDQAGESLLRMFWDHQDAVLCCSFKVIVSLSHVFIKAGWSFVGMYSDSHLFL